MEETFDIRVEGRYGSIEDLEWKDIPPLAVLTGENGVGKTQLLEVIANTYGVMQPRPWAPRTLGGYPQVEVRATARITGEEFLRGEVFHSRGEWPPLSDGATTGQAVREAINNLQGSRENSWFWDQLAAESGRSKPELYALAPADFRDLLSPMLVWGARASGSNPNQSLDFLFLLYQLFADRAAQKGADPQSIVARYGEPPWLIFNQILDAAGLRYQVDVPRRVTQSFLEPEASLSVRLVERETGELVNFAGLSSGEKVLVSTAFWWFGAKQLGKHPRLLLLDEPDAHLHPALTRRFLEIVQEVFVKARGVRVILTTHSPSTVALTPDGSLFEMRRSGIPRIIPQKNKAPTIALLTDGLLVVEKPTQIVFVEGPDDPEFYALVWDIITHRDGGTELKPLEPSPNLIFVHGNGAATVKAVVRQMRQHALTRFHGIIDHDVNNQPEDGVHVLERNALESYLYEPLNIWAYLHMQGLAFAVTGVVVPPGLSAQIGKLSPATLQLIVDAMCGEVVKNLSLDGETTTRVREVSFGSSIVLKYPDWIFTCDDKKLKAAFHKSFPLGAHSTKKLYQSFATLRLIPSDLRNMLSSIQQEAIISS